MAQRAERAGKRGRRSGALFGGGVGGDVFEDGRDGIVAGVGGEPVADGVAGVPFLIITYYITYYPACYPMPATWRSCPG